MVLIGAGDVASCESPNDELTALLLDQPGVIFVAGDVAYERGTPDEFARCFHTSWGRFKDRIRPAIGNHEYYTPGAVGYHQYFGDAAGRPGFAYYSYDIGEWHVVVLDSNCLETGGCDVNSRQGTWLREDLARRPTRCLLAYWHHPRFSSGLSGSYARMAPLFRLLYEAGAELVISGHDHNYERFAPQDADGRLELERGVRQFVVGTGGRSFTPPGSPAPNSEVQRYNVFGVLKLTLADGSYSWEFVAARGFQFSDSGSADCR